MKKKNIITNKPKEDVVKRFKTNYILKTQFGKIDHGRMQLYGWLDSLRRDI